MINLLVRNNKIISQNRRYKGELVDSMLMIILSWLEPSTLELLFVTFATIIEPTFEPQPRNRFSDLQGHDQIVILFLLGVFLSARQENLGHIPCTCRKETFRPVPHHYLGPMIRGALKSSAFSL